jgi:hypothetical protein
MFCCRPMFLSRTSKEVAIEFFRLNILHQTRGLGLAFKSLFPVRILLSGHPSGSDILSSGALNKDWR